MIDLGSIAFTISPLLSQQRSTGLVILVITSSSIMNFVIYTASLAASYASNYSAYYVELEIMLYLELFPT